MATKPLVGREVLNLVTVPDRSFVVPPFCHVRIVFAGQWDAGDAAGARDLLAALLPVRERASGPEHPDSLLARRQLAYWTERAERGPSRA